MFASEIKAVEGGVLKYKEIPLRIDLCSNSPYHLAWISHVFLERNRPATFTHPIWSFMGDFRMFVLACGGRLNNELKKYGIGT